MDSGGDERSEAPLSRETQPIFLRKTWQILSTCDEELACWGENGDSFVIKDAEAFANTVLPQFFKHNKFASFIRQLNLYSFKKIRSSADLSVNHTSQKWWEFKHPCFLRDQPQLLSQIRRARAAAPAPDGSEIGQLRSEISELHELVLKNNEELGHLRQAVERLLEVQHPQSVGRYVTGGHMDIKRSESHELFHPAKRQAIAVGGGGSSSTDSGLSGGIGGPGGDLSSDAPIHQVHGVSHARPPPQYWSRTPMFQPAYGSPNHPRGPVHMSHRPDGTPAGPGSAPPSSSPRLPTMDAMGAAGGFAGPTHGEAYSLHPASQHAGPPPNWSYGVPMMFVSGPQGQMQPAQALPGTHNPAFPGLTRQLSSHEFMYPSSSGSEPLSQPQPPPYSTGDATSMPPPPSGPVEAV